MPEEVKEEDTLASTEKKHKDIGSLLYIIIYII